MTRTTSAIEQVSIGEPGRGPDQHESTIIREILQKLSKMDLSEQEGVKCYMRQKWRLNHEPNTLRNSLKAIELFLTFYTSLGKSRLEEIVRNDLEAFVESERDRGPEITSARARLMYLLGFLRFLIEDDVIPEALLGRKIRLIFFRERMLQLLAGMSPHMDVDRDVMARFLGLHRLDTSCSRRAIFWSLSGASSSIRR
jgi:hypothetical protein